MVSRAELWRKFVQRRLRSFILSPWGLIIFVLSSIFLFNILYLFVFGPCAFHRLSTVASGGTAGLLGPRMHCSRTSFKDNIGGIDFEGRLSYESIDVVYTWVNGSDPVWQAKKVLWVERERALSRAEEAQQGEQQQSHSRRLLDSEWGEVMEDYPDLGDDFYGANGADDALGYAELYHGLDPYDAYALEHHHYFIEALEEDSPEPAGNQTNATTAAQNATTDAPAESADHESLPEEPEDAMADAASDNRYRDSNELKYSLRSLEKYAPWVRHVYIVTDNQIPSWLDLSNPRITVVPHARIFPNRSHLPVFSSPAIETHLHRITGLSNQFAYFNDDVFLGAETWPDDFVSLSGAQKIYLSWDVPKCNEGCTDSWLGDGYCDKACNCSRCAFDFGDCVNKTEDSEDLGQRKSKSNRHTSKKRTTPKHCARGCPELWVGDGACDTRCNRVECGFDAGDCGFDLMFHEFAGAVLPPSFCVDELHTNRSSLNDTSDSGAGGAALEHVDNETSSRALLLSMPYGTKGFYVNLSEAFPRDEFTFTSSSHNNELIVHNSVLLSAEGVLVVLLINEDIDSYQDTMKPMLPSWVTVTLTAHATHQPLLTRTVVFDAMLLPASDGNSTNQTASFVHPESAELTRRHRTPAPANLSTLPAFVPGYSSVTGGGGSLGTSHTSSPHADAVLLDHPSAGQAMNRSFANATVGEVSYFAVQRLRSQSGEPLGTALSPLRLWGEHGSVGLDADRLFPLDRHRHPLSGALALPAAATVAPLLRPVNRTAVVTVARRVHLLLPAFAESTAPRGWLSGSLHVVGLPDTCLKHGGASLEEVVRAIEATIAPQTARKKSTGWFGGAPQCVGSVADSVSFLVQWGEQEANGDAALAPSRRRLLSSPSRPKLAFGEKGHQRAQHAIRISGGDHPRTAGKALRGRPHPHQQRQQRQPSQGRRPPGDFRMPSHPPNDPLWANVDWVFGMLRPHMIGHHANQRAGGRRRLLDTFGDSLIHVNQLYHRKYGSDSRRVPAHMPHFIDKRVMQRLQADFPKEWDETSTHRFRSSTDMQYGFAYFYYIVNVAKTRDLDWDTLWTKEIDVDRDGMLNANEFLTLASMANGREPKDEYLDKLHSCMTAADTEGMQPKYFTKKHMLGCDLAVDGLRKNVKRPAEYQFIKQLKDEVAFEMIGDDFNKTRDQLNSIRARKTKFVCVNDDMKHPTPELVRMLQDFYLSFFPSPSQFELPNHLTNRYLYLDEYESAVTAHRATQVLLALFLVGLVIYLLYDCFLSEDAVVSPPDIDGTPPVVTQANRPGHRPKSEAPISRHQKKT